MAYEYHPITQTLIDQLAACEHGGGAPTIFRLPNVSDPLYLKLGESGAWSVGFSSTGAVTISESDAAELAGARAQLDGSTPPNETGFYLVGTTVRALYLDVDNGLALPGDIPPPPPPPP